MQNLRIVITALVIFARTVLGYAFTELLVDSADYTRTYTLGQTVFITWNQTVSAWPRVHLRLDPLSETNAPEYGVTYAILIGLSLPIYIPLYSSLTILTTLELEKIMQLTPAHLNGRLAKMTTSPPILLRKI